MTSGSVMWLALMRSFLGGKRCGPLDQEDLTVEMDSTFRIPRPQLIPRRCVFHL